MRSALLALALTAASAGLAHADAKADNAAFLAKNATAEGVKSCTSILDLARKHRPCPL